MADNGIALTKKPVANPTYSFVGDENTGFTSTSEDTVAIVCGGTTQVTYGSSKPAVNVVKVALASADTAGGVLAWANPTGATIFVTRIIFDVTTKATGACTVDVGTAADGTTSNDTLMDGLDVGTAAGVFDNVENQGTNGVGVKKVTSSQYVTASKASGAAAGLVGYAYIHYHLA